MCKYWAWDNFGYLLRALFLNTLTTKIAKGHSPRATQVARLCLAVHGLKVHFLYVCARATVHRAAHGQRRKHGPVMDIVVPVFMSVSLQKMCVSTSALQRHAKTMAFAMTK
jgi:hypothetical protein